MQEVDKLTKEEYYDERGKSYETYDQEALVRYRKALAWLDLDCAPVIYEVGCKFGELNKMLLSTGKSFTYKAVDIDQTTLQKISEYSTKQFICGNVNEGLPFPDDSADYIICMEVMEHLENATFFLEEVERVLNENGKLILSVPNPYCWLEILHNMRKCKDTEGHIATYTHQNINALMNFSALKLVAITGTFSRIPFSRRLTGKARIFKTNLMFLTRNYVFLIGK